MHLLASHVSLPKGFFWTSFQHQDAKLAMVNLYWAYSVFQHCSNYFTYINLLDPYDNFHQTLTYIWTNLKCIAYSYLNSTNPTFPFPSLTYRKQGFNCTVHFLSCVTLINLCVTSLPSAEHLWTFQLWTVGGIAPFRTLERSEWCLWVRLLPQGVVDGIDHTETRIPAEEARFHVLGIYLLSGKPSLAIHMWMVCLGPLLDHTDWVGRAKSHLHIGDGSTTKYSFLPKFVSPWS